MSSKDMQYNLRKDIYFLEKYARLYLSEEGKLLQFNYERGEHIFSVLGLIEPINQVGTKNVRDRNFYDAQTAYGYGGYYSSSHQESFLEEAMTEYRSFAKAQGIVADFVRFHPFLQHSNSLKEKLDFFVHNNDLVIVDLSLNKENRWKSYSSGTRNILRRANENLMVRVSKDLDQFMELYYDTMTRNAVGEFYYFPKQYFEQLLYFSEVELYSVYYGDTIISTGLFMHGADFGHYHLSANHQDYFKLNGNYLLLDFAIEAAREKGLKTFLMGGGRTNKADDGLFKFKKKFSKETVPFYIGGNIFDQDSYKELNDIWQKENPDDQRKYFLKYRL